MKFAASKAAVPTRWRTWLSQEMLAAALAREVAAGRTPAVDTEEERAALARGLIGALAAASASDPENRDTHPRADIGRWLRDSGKFVSPERCFTVAQALGDIGVRPVPSGLLGLLAAGHSCEAVNVAYALLVRGLMESTPTISEPPLAPRKRPKREREAAEAVVRYCVRFIGQAHVIVSNLDGVPYSAEERAAAHRVLGDAPHDAIGDAWKARLLTRLPPNITVDETIAGESAYDAQVLAFAGFAELTKHYVSRDPRWHALWKEQHASWLDYLRRADGRP